MTNPTCIVVLGMHRSGTSLVAGLLRRLGVNMGASFRKPDRHNDLGYFGDLDWLSLNKALINDAGGRWFNPPNEEDVDNALDVGRVEALVQARSGLWGFKDPRTVFTIHALEHYLPDLLWQLVLRLRAIIVATSTGIASFAGMKNASRCTFATSEGLFWV